MSGRQAGRVRARRTPSVGGSASSYGPEAPYSAAAYAAEAYGSATLTLPKGQTGLRGLLMGSAAAATLFLSVPRQAYGAPQPCTVAGDTVTCEGDQSAGVYYNSVVYDTLIVQNLTTDITPPPGVDGVKFSNDTDGDDLTVRVDLLSGPGAPHVISVVDAQGIYVYDRNRPDTGALDVESLGDIVGSGTAGGIDVRTEASNFAGGTASAGAVRLSHTGDIDTPYSAVEARSSSGAYDEFASGNSTAGDVSVTIVGNVAQTNAASFSIGVIEASSVATKDFSAASPATIGDTLAGNVSIDQTGDVTGADPDSTGLYGESVARAFANFAGTYGKAGDTRSGNVSVVSRGDTAVGNSGIDVRSYAATRVADYGAPASRNAVAGNAFSGNVLVDSAGTITADDGVDTSTSALSSAQLYYVDGVVSARAGNATGGDATVSHQGDIIATGNYGDAIDAYSSARSRAGSGGFYSPAGASVASAVTGNVLAGDVRVSSSGDIATLDDAILANSYAGTGGSFAEAIGADSASFEAGDATSGNVFIEHAGDLGGDVDGYAAARSTAVASSLLAATATAGSANSGGVVIATDGAVNSEDDGINGRAQAGSFAAAYGSLPELPVYSYDAVALAVATGTATANATAAIAAAGDVSVTQIGALSAAYRGIEARSYADSDALAAGAESFSTATGVLSSGTAVAGIEGATRSGDVTVYSRGAISAANAEDAYGTGIVARSRANTDARAAAGSLYYAPVALANDLSAQAGDAASGNVSIDSEGAVTGEDGIRASSDAASQARSLDALSAEAAAGSAASGAVTIRQVGDVTAAAGTYANDGIEAVSGAEADAFADTHYSGSAASATAGDAASGAVEISFTGDLTMGRGIGLLADSYAGTQARARLAYCYCGDIVIPASAQSVTAQAGNAVSGSASVSHSGTLVTGYEGVVVESSAYTEAEAYSTGTAAATAGDAEEETRSGHVTAVSRGDISAGNEEDEYNGVIEEVYSGAIAAVSDADTDAFAYAASQAAAEAGKVSSGNVIVDGGGDLSGDYGILAASTAAARASAYGGPTAGASAGPATSRDVTVLQQGDIDVLDGERSGNGIRASSDADSQARSLNALSAEAAAGNATSGAVTVRQVGDVTTAADDDQHDGIAAYSEARADAFARTHYTGTDASATAGDAASGAVGISFTGDLTIGRGTGIYASSFARTDARGDFGDCYCEDVAFPASAQIVIAETGNAVAATASVSHAGALVTGYEGIVAESDAYAVADAYSTGAAAATAGGAEGETRSGDVTAVSRGDISAGNEEDEYDGVIEEVYSGAIAAVSDADTGTFAYAASQAAAEAGKVSSGSVIVDSGGDLSGDYGILAASNAAARASAYGGPTAGASAGAATSRDVTVLHQGEIDVLDGERSGNGIIIYSYAEVAAEARAFQAGGSASSFNGDASSGAVSVTSVGDISAPRGAGISADTSASTGYSDGQYEASGAASATMQTGEATSGDASIHQAGAVTSYYTGLYATSRALSTAVAKSAGTASASAGDASAGSVIVTANGPISSGHYDGIYAASQAGSFAGAYGSPGGADASATTGAATADDVSVISDSSIVAAQSGIVALSEAYSLAAVYAAEGGALLALEGGATSGGDVSVESGGATDAAIIGIDARSRGGFGNVVVESFGDINVAGSADPQPLPALPAGTVDPDTIRAGILAFSGAGFGFSAAAGATAVTLDAAAITTSGGQVHGIAAFGATNEVVLQDRASIVATGDAAAGILVGPQVSGAFVPAVVENGVVVQGGASTYAAAGSTNVVRVGTGSGVASQNGIAILDIEGVAFREDVEEGEEAGDIPAATVASAQNQTRVEIAGTVAGGQAAVVLNGADDEVAIDPGYTITGLVDGGEGGEVDGDTFAFGIAEGCDCAVTFDVGLIDGNDTLNSDDQYVNFENFLKQGPSTFTLVGDNPEILELPVLGGELLVNGTLVNAFIPISSGGLLGGTGTIGSFDAGPGAIVAPGASIGTLHVTGDGHFAAGSLFQVEVNADGRADLLEVGGVVTIDGGTIDVRGEPGSYPHSQLWTVITAQAVTGTFNEVVDDLPDIEVFDIYEPDSVLLGYTKETSGSLTHKENAPASLVGAGFDALNFAETLQERGHFLAAGFSPAMPALAYLPVPEADARGAAFLATNGVADAAVAASPAARAGFGVWAGAFGTAVEDDGEDGFDSKSLGLAGGVEAVLGDAYSSSVIGLAFGHSETDVSVTDGDADIEGVHVGLYGAHQRGRLNVSAAAGYSWFDFDLSRRIELDGGGSVGASAEPDGHALSGSLQVSYDIAEILGTPGWLVAPTARINAISAHRDGFTEEGADILDLTVEEDDLNQVLPAAGISLGTTWRSGGLVVKPELQLLYEHVFGDADVTGQSAIPVADATFTTEVSAGGRNRLALGAGLGIAFSDNISAHIRYDGSLSGEADSHRASGAFSVRF